MASNTFFQALLLEVGQDTPVDLRRYPGTPEELVFDLLTTANNLSDERWEELAKSLVLEINEIFDLMVATAKSEINPNEILEKTPEEVKDLTRISYLKTLSNMSFPGLAEHMNLVDKTRLEEEMEVEDVAEGEVETLDPRSEDSMSIPEAVSLLKKVQKEKKLSKVQTQHAVSLLLYEDTMATRLEVCAELGVDTKSAQSHMEHIDQIFALQEALDDADAPESS